MELLDRSLPLIHLLLVEDDEVDIQDIIRVFKQNKIINPLHVARNGVEALNMLRGTNGEAKLVPTPKIILLDLNLPKMDGIEFLKALRADPILKSILVCVLTSSNEDRDKQDAYNLNVAGYILKPVQLSDFIEVISTLKNYWALLEFPS